MYPGYDLALGENNDYVKYVQEKLALFFNNPNILREQGYFGPLTLLHVLMFQHVFDMLETGVVDETTWKKLTEV